MAEYLREKRNLRTGKAKGEHGRPKTGERKRRANSPVHLATEIYLVLRGSLAVIYPTQSQDHIDERAMSLAAKLKGVEAESIHIHFNKSKHNRRLPYRILGHTEEESRPTFVVDVL
jgi:hypothetical protein